MKVTLPKLIEAGVVFNDDGDDTFTSYVVSNGYHLSTGYDEVGVIQHIHNEDEPESLSLIDDDYQSDPTTVDVDDIYLTEFDLRVYKELSVI